MKPFNRLRVIEIAGSQAGAFAAKMFSDYGADVVKVEPPAGDPLRANGESLGPIGSEFAFLNTGKRSLCIDLEGQSGRASLKPVLEAADVIIESSAPAPLVRRTLNLENLTAIRALISPFGLSGPYAAYRSNVFTDDAIGGHMGLSGEPDREPLKRAGLHTHYQAGMHAFIGCMAALLAREKTGRGQTVEVSHFEGMASLHQHTTSMWIQAGHVLRREGNSQPGPWHPTGVYPCKDGYVFLGHSGGAKLIPFVELLGYGHLFDDPRFATDAARGAHKREFDEALAPRLMELTADEIIDLGRIVFSPIGPVPEMLDVLNDPQYVARQFWKPLSGASNFKIGRGPVQIDGHPALPGPAPEQPGSVETDALVDEWQDAFVPTSAPERITNGPLQGIRILDLTRVWAGPIAGRILADLGADVIHIESPWNRGVQFVDPALAALNHLYPDNEVGDRPWNRSSGFNKLARNKRAVSLNLQDSRAKDLFAGLVRHSDVVLENYSPRVMPQLGFDYAALAAINPSIVYTSMPGYGASGPGQNRVALGPVIEAAVGLTAMMGYRDGPPYRSGVAWSDPVSGLSAAAGTLIALYDRAASGGKSQRVESAMSESMAIFVGEELLAAQVRGSNAQRIGNRDHVHAPQGVYSCAGHDRWVAISITSDDEWAALCRITSLPAALAPLTVAQRHARHDEIDQQLSLWTRARSPRAAMAALQRAGIIAAVVSDARDLAEDIHLEARGFWAEMDHADVGLRRYPGIALTFSETPVSYRLPPPLFGEHNDEIYGGLLGIAPAALGALRDARIIADLPPATVEDMVSERQHVSPKG